MRRQLVLSRLVESDLDDIASYIAQDSPRQAVNFVRQIRRQFATIMRNPEIYRLRPEIGEGARMATLGHYAILFRLDAASVRIERVVFSGRDLPDLFDC